MCAQRNKKLSYIVINIELVNEFVVGLADELVYEFVIGLANELVNEFVIGFLIGLIIGLVVGLVIGLVSQIISDIIHICITSLASFRAGPRNCGAQLQLRWRGPLFKIYFL